MWTTTAVRETESNGKASARHVRPTYYECVPGSSVGVLRHSVGGSTYRHYGRCASPSPVPHEAEFPRPTTSGLLKGVFEAPCVDELF